MRGECPVAGAGAPGSGAPRILFLTVFTIDIWRFEVHLSCSVWVVRRDSITAHVWYGLQTNLVSLGYMDFRGPRSSAIRLKLVKCSQLFRCSGGLLRSQVYARPLTQSLVTLFRI